MPSSGKFLNVYRTIVLLVAEQSRLEMAPLLGQYRARLEHALLRLSAAAQDHVSWEGA